MKKIASIIALTTIVLFSCSKKKDNPTPSVTEVATLSVSVGADDSMRITVHYTDKNTGTYLNDLVKIYINDTFSAVHTIDPKPVNSDVKVVAFSKYTGTKYKVTLEREITSGNKSLIKEVSGN